VPFDAQLVSADGEDRRNAITMKRHFARAISWCNTVQLALQGGKVSKLKLADRSALSTARFPDPPSYLSPMPLMPLRPLIPSLPGHAAGVTSRCANIASARCFESIW
jgi:hypothetical protein